MCGMEARDGKWWAIVCTEGDQATTDCNNTSLLIRDSTVQWKNKPPRACFLSLTQFPRRRKCCTFIYLWRISHSKRRSTNFFFFLHSLRSLPLWGFLVIDETQMNIWNFKHFYPCSHQDSWDALSVIISPYACYPVKMFGIHGIQMMNQNNSGGLIFSSIATPAGERFHLSLS